MPIDMEVGMTALNPAVDTLCVNTIRCLAIDAIQKANSGHPGLPLGAAPMAYVLWQYFLKHNPADPAWPDRDRFVLSGGHGSSLLYSLLHLTGYDLSMDELKSFRQWGSRTPGHPEVHATPGVEATTGPLGQGSANAVGMAIAERFLAGRFNRPGFEIINHFTYALVTDGDLMEGLSAEAGSLAGHLKLGKLICLYDSNRISLDGPTSLAFTEDVARRYEAYGWQVLHVQDGDRDLAAIRDALDTARADTTRPSMIIVNTTIGFGSPGKQGTSSCHGSPLGPDEVALTKKTLGMDPQQSFHVPADAGQNLRLALINGAAAQRRWRELFRAYAVAHPDLAEEWELAWSGQMPAGFDADLPRWKPGDKLATRVAGGAALNALAARVPWLLGGDADLSCSTQTSIRGAGSFDAATGQGRNIHYGVREAAMGSVANGMTYHGGVRTWTATFFSFLDYMKPAVRLAAMNRLPVTFVFTHDSLEVGEDGPTHQPVEQLMNARTTPGLYVVRPCDAAETAEAWRFAMLHNNAPTVLVLTRQNVPVLDRVALGVRGNLAQGAYVLADAEGGAPQAIILATGSEVHVALAARTLLQKDGLRVRVVALPCWEAFLEQPREYRDAVLPPSIRARVSVEAGTTLGWERWIGLDGIAIGVDRYGASAPGPIIMKHYGITPDKVAEAVRTLL